MNRRDGSRFSVSSIDPLPFGGVIRVVTEARKIGHQFLTSAHLSGIPWSELRQVGPDDGSTSTAASEPAPPPLDVFVASLLDGRALATCSKIRVLPSPAGRA